MDSSYYGNLAASCWGLDHAKDLLAFDNMNRFGREYKNNQSFPSLLPGGEFLYGFPTKVSDYQYIAQNQMRRRKKEL